MSTETEALREQFEAWARKNELEAERHKYADDQYDDHAATSAWWAWRDAFQAGHAAAKAETAAAVAQERDYWRKELHALLEAADAVATNNAHAVSTGSVRYAKYSQTWGAYASLDKARQRAADAIRAGAKERGE